jgi:hypothetical protein
MMRRQTMIATCLLNHRIQTSSQRKLDKWWANHEHEDIENVLYDDNGDVEVVHYK